MFVNVDAVHDSPDFPTQVDVVIIGAGIVGTSAAYELARQGISVALLEKGLIGCEQSSRNWGWVRQQNRDMFELPLAMYSLDRWEAFSGEIGRDVGFRRSGIVYTTDSQASMSKWEAWGKQAREQGFISHVIGAEEAGKRAPGTTSCWIGGVWSPSDGRAEPAMACAAIATGARELGAYVHQNCAVRGLEQHGGRISGVWTERGLVRTSTVVCAGGAWSSRFCRRHGIELPSANIMGTALQTTAAPEVTPGCLTTPNIALRRRLDGSYTLAMPGRGRVEISPQGLRYATKFYGAYRSKLAKKLQIRVSSSFFRGPEAAGSWQFDQISPFEQQRILDPEPDMALARASLAALHKEYPALSGVHIARAWAGMIDTTPDMVPVISAIDAIPGFIVAAGFSGHGFGIGPGAGRLVTDLVTGSVPVVDPAPYHIERFSDGSRIRQPEMM
ncbi:NAD(P)/FAD-dependent oxidoreductase [Phytohalomonas tamaricis]|uniref:NAD(P)/FAD-dependent oxidoreductase n=1 Tax=Phytohalomonas tamaricis TaxID=2081032 RepID=UPI000D0B6B6D|nr:FAD-binding oxidoreductase [Phytohalomonas tamaricis]